jgi:flagellar motor switch protein FliM
LAEANRENWGKCVDVISQRRTAPPRRTGDAGIGQPAVRPLSLGRPEHLSPEQIAGLSAVHEGFARRAGEALSAYLRSPVRLHLKTVQQLSYEECARALPDPGALAVVELEPFAGTALLAVDQPFAFAAIDRLLGGRGDSAAPARGLSDIERAVMENIVHRLMAPLAAAWQPVRALRPRLSRIETAPEQARIAAPREAVVRLTFDLRLRAAGTMHFLIPLSALAPVRSRLGPRSCGHAERREERGAEAGGRGGGRARSQRATLGELLRAAPLPVTVELGGACVPLRAILELTAGDVLPLDRVRPGDELAVKVGGRTKFMGRPGVVGGRLAVQIRAPARVGGGPE